jgi:hypothetical protein
MRSTSRLFGLAMVVVAACGGGGGGDDDGPPDAAVAPVFRNPLPNLSDDEVALQALQLMGAQVADADSNCNVCHSLSRAKLRNWQGYSDDSMADCLTNLEVTDPGEAVPMVDCLRDNPGDATSEFRAHRLGLYATGAQLPWFDYLFHLAHPVDGDAMYVDFVSTASMPRGGHAPYTQGEFDIIAEWVARGMPLLDTLVPEQSFGDCTPSITTAMTDHIEAMATQGWAAVNEAAGINMFGCAGAATVRDCLDTYPRAADTVYGDTWETALPGSVLRVLRVNDYESDYWTRSSADGRFVAHGGSGGPSASDRSTFIDLERDAEVYTTSLYDPGFFPDNSGWMIQGTSGMGSIARVCSSSVLTAEPPPARIDFSGAVTGCSYINAIGLYEHAGRALNDGDYFTVAGQFESDDPGGPQSAHDPQADFSTSVVRLVPLIFDGTTYQAKTSVQTDLTDTAEMGDTAINPAATHLFSRVNGPNNGQSGFRVHAINASPSGGTYTVDPEVVATYCVNGGKPGFSYDERFMTVHHFATGADAVELGFSGANDPAFAPYLQQGVANIYLVDLLTGDKTRVTNMKPGQYALYPHFRSDGWMYFMVQTQGQAPEYIVASDAALVVAGN